MPCPHFSIEITSRGKGGSAMAGAAYYSGETLYSEYDHAWKYPHSDPTRIVHKEIMLPSNAPRAYADRQTLWNAVDASEKQADAQTARRILIALPRELTSSQNLELIRSYCQKQFVDKGMICDLCVHDKDNSNPHAHIMLTMRALDEHGAWLPKTKTSYVLDAQGERVKKADGKWLRERRDTVDWNDRKYCEIWRHEWELAQNKALEKAGCQKRVNMRSFERQGVTDLAPTVHLGPVSTALERKGIDTVLGNRNREIRSINAMIIAIQKTLRTLSEWVTKLKDTIRRQEVIENPDDYHVGDVLFAYLDMRRQERAQWSGYARNKATVKDLQEGMRTIDFLRRYGINTVQELGEYLCQTDGQLRDLRSTVRQKEGRIRDIGAILDAEKTVRELSPILDAYNGIFWKQQKEKYASAHADELNRVKKAQRLLHKLNVALPIDRKALVSEMSQLEQEREALRPQIELLQSNMTALKTVRYWVRKVIPEALPARTVDGSRTVSDELDSARNSEELRAVLENDVQAVLREGDVQEVAVSKLQELKDDEQHGR